MMLTLPRTRDLTLNYLVLVKTPVNLTRFGVSLTQLELNIFTILPVEVNSMVVKHFDAPTTLLNEKTSQNVGVGTNNFSRLSSLHAKDVQDCWDVTAR